MKVNYDVQPLDGYHPEIAALLSCLVDGTREWRENLERPKVEAIVWQSAPDAQSIGALILHMIDCESYWFEAFAAGKRRDKEEVKLLLSEEVHQYGGRWPVPPAEPIEWYFELQDRIRARCFEAIKGIEPGRQFDRKNYGCTFRWVMAHIVQHDSYHGGQAVMVHEAWKKQRSKSLKSKS